MEPLAAVDTLATADRAEAGRVAVGRAEAERVAVGWAEADRVRGTGAAAFEALVQTGVVMAPR
ncbi:hypothetical protein [Streptomyces griseiscabiei]|uniref:Uncharacterized protein n=1 Tax=Streptomyces griseiscabiei TaxID=2993540 RepID=A0ABU4LA52_9ACTN|nr:hypothetical protein [Streptomyces griseiscabiei]MBZ3907698.1 hypothetical protein [Streptomyces griseiscabiei]MDX2912617.1 hypothetical protein [Streptomyces griseiscabiei]